MKCTLKKQDERKNEQKILLNEMYTKKQDERKNEQKILLNEMYTKKTR